MLFYFGQIYYQGKCYSVTIIGILHIFRLQTIENIYLRLREAAASILFLLLTKQVKPHRLPS